MVFVHEMVCAVKDERMYLLYSEKALRFVLCPGPTVSSTIYTQVHSIAVNIYTHHSILVE